MEFWFPVSAWNCDRDWNLLETNLSLWDCMSSIVARPGWIDCAEDEVQTYSWEIAGCGIGL